MHYRNEPRRTRDKIIEAEIKKLELRRASDARAQRELERLRRELQPRGNGR
jgi:uncharacterized protein involved in exopolysaccharide biosynthesis